MYSLKPPEQLLLSGNLEQNWRKFKQRLEWYLKATGYAKKKEDEKAALLHHVAGEEAIEVYNNFVFGDREDNESYTTLVGKLKAYCIPLKNTYERYIFRVTQHQEGEPFEQFLRGLKTKVQSCNSGGITGSMLRYQIVLGIADKKL